MNALAESPRNTTPLATLTLGALGVVYGDIGTSPLYALRECFHGPHAVVPTESNVLGVLSLIVWSLLLVISLKYLLIVMRADNDGEGGILALMALVSGVERDRPNPNRSSANGAVLVLVGLFGAALLYGDGIITPAISVLSAVEGLNLATPVFEPYVVPMTVVVLAALFWFQRFGTEGIGFVFGPIMLVWFSILAVTGVIPIVGNPSVLAAVNPVHAVEFLMAHSWPGFLVLGIVFLVVTGGEALYADMGHFGKQPIRLAWFVVVLPALLLNYFGQGALILANAEHATSPFFHLVSGWLRYPMIGMATIATVIASQAVITGAFSLTMQAVQLGYLPRVEIRHSSTVEYGQVYVPVINGLLFVLTLAVVFGFGSSSRLASAYGVAVTTTMVITTVLAFRAMRDVWQWSLSFALIVTAPLLVIDVCFFVGNVAKFFDGGWFPFLVAAAAITVMTTWRRGRQLLGQRLSDSTPNYEDFFRQLDEDPPVRVAGTEVHLASNSDRVPTALARNVKHNRVLHEQVAVVTVQFEKHSYVRSEDRVTCEILRPNFFRICVRYGFNQRPNVPRALAVKELENLQIDRETTTYVLGRETLVASSRRPGMAVWREMLFAFLARNACQAAEYFNIPSARVLEIGGEIIL